MNGLCKILALLLTVCMLASGCGHPAVSPEDTGEEYPGEVSSDTASTEERQGEAAEKERSPEWNKMEYTASLKLNYAKRFSVDYYGDYVWISIVDSGNFLLVPEGKAVPEGLPEDVIILRGRPQSIYLVATSAMDFFVKLNGLDRIRFSGTKSSGWYLPEAAAAMEEGAVLYAGKYSAPDYELLLENGCDLAVESTMILHNPKVKEQLERLGIPVLVERSSYESHPLGRMEWIKLYGVLLGCEAEAEEFFEKQTAQVLPFMEQQQTGKSVAFFSIDTNGAVTVRKSGDYIAKMISLAGGSYVPRDEKGEENALSTTKMQPEAFYEAAHAADCIIYNSAIEGELEGLSQLLEKSPLLEDFAAVKSGQVFCTGKNLFQETTGIGALMQDLHRILTEQEIEDDQLVYLRRLR